MFSLKPLLPPREPTKSEIKSMRTLVLEQVRAAKFKHSHRNTSCSSGGGSDSSSSDSDDGNSLFDQRDVTRVASDDVYLRRFLLQNDNDEGVAVRNAMDTLYWRKKHQVNDISAVTVESSLFADQQLFAHNRDVNGCKVLIFTVRRHFKNEHNITTLMRFFVYWIERLEREEHGKTITIFFDMGRTSLININLEFVQLMVKILDNYYPWLCNRVIIFDMPWLLNAIWKVINSWLPRKSAEKIKFVDSKTVTDYIPYDQCLVSWGGSDPYEFRMMYEAEVPAPWLRPVQPVRPSCRK